MEKQYTMTEYFSSEKAYLEMLEYAISNAEVGFLIADAAGNVVKVNQAQVEITNQEPSYNVGRNMREVQIEDGSPSATVQVIDTGLPAKIEQHLNNGNSYLVYAAPCRDAAGDLKYVVSTLLDTTEINRTITRIREDNKRLNLQLAELQNQMDPQDKIIHQSKIMRQAILLCDKAAQFDSNILLVGESGVGKERFAEYIFEKSNRNKEPFIKINCASIPEQLLESELFGYEKGAFTGADKEGKKGILDYANGGTLLLDEISELAMPLQAKLLRFLQDGEYYRVGGRQVVVADVRMIAASNRDLEQMVKAGDFRGDLFHRLNVIPIHIPPLRERQEDIPLLVGYFTKKFNEKYGIQKSWHAEALKKMLTLPYEGNVRELQNLIERILILTEGPMVEIGDVLRIVEMAGQALACKEEIGLKEMVQSYERQIILQYMERYGTEALASKALRVSQSTISRKLNHKSQSKNAY